jgi:hypothetical protein
VTLLLLLASLTNLLGLALGSLPAWARCCWTA